MEKKTYEQNIHCDNCGHSWIEAIVKGRGAKGTFTCPNCGVREGRSTGKPDRLEDRIRF